MSIKYSYNVKNKETIGEEIEDIEIIIPNSIKIEMIKRQLTDSDYQAIKYAEGQITEEDYAPIKAQRQAWRDEINRLEGEIVESEN